jgi:hypothetical protein
LVGVIGRAVVHKASLNWKSGYHNLYDIDSPELKNPLNWRIETTFNRIKSDNKFREKHLDECISLTKKQQYYRNGHV